MIKRMNSNSYSAVMCFNGFMGMDMVENCKNSIFYRFGMGELIPTYNNCSC